MPFARNTLFFSSPECFVIKSSIVISHFDFSTASLLRFSFQNISKDISEFHYARHQNLVVILSQRCDQKSYFSWLKPYEHPQTTVVVNE